eukprot:5403246-Ditylum_brightwellii.AAC.1
MFGAMRGRKKSNIPRLMDDYNHWMDRVGVYNQRIIYYHPNLCCSCNWVPIFLQIQSIMRNSAYVVHKDHYGNNALSHKRFTMEW